MSSKKSEISEKIEYIDFYSVNVVGNLDKTIKTKKYIKYRIPTSKIAHDVGGFSMNTIFVGLSNSKMIITNNLQYIGQANRLSKNSLKGTIYNMDCEGYHDTLECYIYNNNKKIVDRGIFCAEKGYKFSLMEDPHGRI
jgi:hypothetical protein